MYYTATFLVATEQQRRPVVLRRHFAAPAGTQAAAAAALARRLRELYASPLPVWVRGLRELARPEACLPCPACSPAILPDWSLAWYCTHYRLEHSRLLGVHTYHNWKRLKEGRSDPCPFAPPPAEGIPVQQGELWPDPLPSTASAAP